MFLDYEGDPVSTPSIRCLQGQQLQESAAKQSLTPPKQVLAMHTLPLKLVSLIIKPLYAVFALKILYEICQTSLDRTLAPIVASSVM